MKKVISVILLLAMVIGCFAGCATEPKEDAALNAAAEYLYAMYKDSKATTDADYTVVSQIRIDDVVYPITWSSDKADNVQAVAGDNGMTTIKVTAAAEDINYKLIATLKNADGLEVSVSFDKIIPAKAVVAGKTIVLAFPKDNQFVSVTPDVYTSSSGSVKNQMDMTENEAEAVSLQIVENSDGTISFVSGEYYLYADGTHATFVKEQGDNTKFVLEAADTDGGYFIKCAYATYSGKAQYLEVYSGNLCSYGMGSDPSIYIFKLQESTVATGTPNMEGGNNSGNNSGSTDNTPSTSTPPATNPPATQPSGGNTGSTTTSGYTQVSSLKDGDKVVIVNPAGKVALSMTKTGYYNVGIDISGGFGSITKDEIFTVKKNSDGSYTFTSLSGKVLALADEYSSLNDTGANNKWELSSAGNKLFYLKNVARSNYLDWYASMSNWSTYAPETLNDDYVLAFYVTTGSGSSSGNSGSSNSGSSNSGSSNSGSSNSGSSNSGSTNSGSSNSGSTSTPAAGKGIVFDFSSLGEKSNDALDNDTALAVLNAAASGSGLVSVSATKVYKGNDNENGAFPMATNCIKVSSSSANGQLVMTFGKKVAKVEILCHDWFTPSDKYPTSSTTIAINGGAAQTPAYNSDATAETLTFNLDGSSETVTIDFNRRVFIFKIVITFAN